MLSKRHISCLRAHAAVMAMLLLVSSGSARAHEVQAVKATPFPVASVHFEQNATDGDVEVVFKAKGDDAGLATLIVVSPDGRTVIDFTAPDGSTLGIRQFGFESPEPRDIGALKAAYPEGTYTFAGSTFSGAKLVGKSTLSHRLPATVKFQVPAAEAKDVSIEDVKISWSAVPGITSYIVEVEQDELKTRFQAFLPKSFTTMAVPNGFLMPGTEYKLGIGTVTTEGNISFVETSFTTRK